jgi:hypothetical protein
MKWIDFIENNFDTYPSEGHDVLVTDGTNYDVAWYVMSGTYKWMKTDLQADDSKEFNQFKITKWAYIN